jgi:co-chaperonin GroES (HSP10)
MKHGIADMKPLCEYILVCLDEMPEEEPAKKGEVVPVKAAMVMGDVVALGEDYEGKLREGDRVLVRCYEHGDVIEDEGDYFKFVSERDVMARGASDEEREAATNDYAGKMAKRGGEDEGGERASRVKVKIRVSSAKDDDEMMDDGY